MFKNINLLIVVWLVFFSCKKDKPNPRPHVLPKDTTAQVLLVCEGSLGNGNSSLSVYHPLQDSLYQNVFETANGQGLGDIFQSASKVGQSYFFCINNSDKIVVVAANTWLQKATISVAKPRYVLSLSDEKAYVGALFGKQLNVLNTKSYSVTKTINLPYKNVEAMLQIGGYVYTTCWDTACNKIYKIDASSDQLVDSISIAGTAAHALLLDKDNKLWVLAGNAPKNKSASLSKINLSTNKLEQSFLFADGVEAIKMCSNPTKDSLYFIEVDYSGATTNNGIYRMPIDATALPTKAFIPCQSNQYFWALGIDPNSNQIYVGDPKGFVQKSSIMIYNPQAILQKQFTVGLGISSFYFDY